MISHHSPPAFNPVAFCSLVKAAPNPLKEIKVYFQHLRKNALKKKKHYALQKKFPNVSSLIQHKKNPINHFQRSLFS